MAAGAAAAVTDAAATGAPAGVADMPVGASLCREASDTQWANSRGRTLNEVIQEKSQFF